MVWYKPEARGLFLTPQWDPRLRDGDPQMHVAQKGLLSELAIIAEPDKHTDFEKEKFEKFESLDWRY